MVCALTTNYCLSWQYFSVQRAAFERFYECRFVCFTAAPFVKSEEGAAGLQLAAGPADDQPHVIVVPQGQHGNGVQGQVRGGGRNLRCLARKKLRGVATGLHLISSSAR